MLPGEIEPFANHHIEKLTEIEAALHPSHRNKVGLVITGAEVAEWCETVDAAANALTRFKVCMADEVEQKQRYAKYAKEHGYPHS